MNPPPTPHPDGGHSRAAGDPPFCPLLLGAGALFAGLGVVAGAMGAHALRTVLSDHMLIIYETAVRYQMYHALALLVLTALAPRLPRCTVRWSGGFFIAGILLFSGSLYMLSLTGTRPLGMLTPIGGSCFILGWLTLLWSAFRLARSQASGRTRTAARTM
ncbi:MAG: DUF423 domain-containing protein [Lautropia sp.]|nr:DUF423 domain-containing protein [Lautropia sp.]